MERNIKAANIKGLTPAVDPAESNEVFSLSGRNYEFDSRGPRSGFGDRLLLPQPFVNPGHVSGARIKLRDRDRSFTFTSDGILEWSETRGGWRPVYLTPDLTESAHRWTWGYLNNYIYFCHPRVGILSYNVDTERCLPHPGPGLPEEPLAVAINNGLLMVLTPTVLAWSQPSNGQDFTPSLGGAGAQVLAERVSGFPVMISSYAGGCLTWTTGGVMRSEFTADEKVFRHKSLQTEYRPVNSFCVTQLDDDTSVILDERGLFKCSGEKPVPFTPLFNEFLGQYIQDNDLKIGTNVRIEWDELRRYLYVSVSYSFVNPIYEECFVLYPNLDQWGQFNEEHYGILPLVVETGDREGDYFGYVDSAGQFRYWNQGSSREVTPEAQTETAMSYDLHYPLIQKPTAAIDGDTGWVVSSSGRVSHKSTPDLPPRASFYAGDGTTPAPAILTGLDSVIRIGLVRMQGDESSEQMSEITGVLLRTGITGPEDTVQVDYNLVPPDTSDEDYNELSGSEDFGLDPTNYVNHSLRLVGTVDATSEFDSVIPEVVETKKGARYYTCSCVGVWHLVEVSAEDVGEFYHIRTLELTGIDAGRLN